MISGACFGPVLKAIQSTEAEQISSHGARNDQILTQFAQVGKIWPKILPTERKDHYQSKLLEQLNGHSHINIDHSPI